MIGDVVDHPQYGRGRVMAAYRGGAEWLVRFESGLRFRRPRQEFSGQEFSGQEFSGQEFSGQGEAAPVRSPAFTPPAPMPRSRFEARSLVEALRVGVAPAQHVRELTIGLENERRSLAAGLSEAHAQGGAVRAVIGDYGHGKSHIVQLSAQEALAQGFLVATTSLDLLELPPHRAFDIYSSLVRDLRYPDSDERGLGPLLELAAQRRAHEALAAASPGLDPLQLALEAFAGTTSSRQRRYWQAWLTGGRRLSAMNKLVPPGEKFPSIYKVGHNARQVAYLVSGLSVLARLCNYSGLAVLIDEAEAYSLLSAQQRPKAGLFFAAVIYAALQDRQNRLQESTFPQHRWRDYPLAYPLARPGGQALFFLFTVTRSDNRLPLEDWLGPEEVLELEPHHSPQEIGQFLQTLQGYHAQAYLYEPGERQGQIRRAAAEHLAAGMRSGRLSIRGVVRLGAELYDLLYLYPDYEVADLLEELREQMR
jgi:hypothetical protein